MHRRHAMAVTLWIGAALAGGGGLGCGDDSGAQTAAGGAGATGGVGGAGEGAGGAGGAAVAPMIASLTTDVTLVTELGATVTFFAEVSDPQGPSDIAGGELHQGPGDVFGSFEATGELDGYRLVLTIDETHAWPEMAYVTFLATFRDQAGNTGERSKVIQFDMGGCSQKPDRESCRACFCQADPAGCASYAAREYSHLFCGNACSSECTAFCASVYAGQPDPMLIDAACEACQPTNDDVAAFEDACLADVPDCFGFLVDMGHCPP